MANNNYEKCLAWATEKGLVIDQRIEYRDGDASGMYALEDIPEGTELVSLPLSIRIPDLEGVDYSNDPVAIPAIHSAALELSKGEKSDYAAFSATFESMESLEQHCGYFFGDEECQVLAKLNNGLLRVLAEWRMLVDTSAKQVKELSPALNDKFILQAVLNYYIKSWGSYGFLPVMDLFKHSDKQNAQFKDNGEGVVSHVALRNIKAGEQIFVNYGSRDLYIHAVAYNNYDVEGLTLIDYAARVIPKIEKGPQEVIAKHLASKFKCMFFENNGAQYMRLMSPGAFLTEDKPNQKLVDIMTILSARNDKELEAGTSQKEVFIKSLEVFIESLASANKVDELGEGGIPEKLKRLYPLLKREQQILENNKKWVDELAKS